MTITFAVVDVVILTGAKTGNIVDDDDVELVSEKKKVNKGSKAKTHAQKQEQNIPSLCSSVLLSLTRRKEIDVLLPFFSSSSSSFAFFSYY
jgi:hypothetical protein